MAGDAIAARFLGELDEKLHWIAEAGGPGASRVELGPELRFALFKSYNIFFRIVGDECRIVRIIHSSRDLRRQKFEGP